MLQPASAGAVKQTPQKDAACFRRRRRASRDTQKYLASPATSSSLLQPNEWAPIVDRSTGQFRRRPVAEEVEYTASLFFQIALRLSAWATLAGFKKLPIISPPRPQDTRDRVASLEEDADSIRSGAMYGMGLRFGLTPPEGEDLRLPSLLKSRTVCCGGLGNG